VEDVNDIRRNWAENQENLKMVECKFDDEKQGRKTDSDSIEKEENEIKGQADGALNVLSGNPASKNRERSKDKCTKKRRSQAILRIPYAVPLLLPIHNGSV
jgi:hypothetical protein